MKFIDNKRFNTLNNHLKQEFSQKVCKIPINAGFTCPNIDGTKGFGGCTYCTASGSGDFILNQTASLEVQFNEYAENIKKKWSNTKYIAYFQSFSNTYAPLDEIKEKFEQVLLIEDVVGISIATRADCITQEIAEYLKELSNRTYLTVELGLQTIHEKTAKIINRCHSYEEFLVGLYMLTDKNIKVCVHIINGLPYETKEMMIETAKIVAQLPIYGVKIHSLHIMNKTIMAKMYEKEKFYIITMEEYIDIICEQIEYFPKNIVIERLTGDGDKNELIAPKWSANKRAVLNGIDKKLVELDTWQSKKYELI